MTIRVGIPRSLAYYSFYPQWRTYLEELGTEVVLSPPTTKEILDQGIRDTVTDACIPIKVFHGHVAALSGQVDFILIPRLVSIDGDATLCPKFLGLSDMIKASVAGTPPLLTPRLDIRDGRFAPLRAWLQAANVLGAGRRRAAPSPPRSAAPTCRWPPRPPARSSPTRKARGRPRNRDVPRAPWYGRGSCRSRSRPRRRRGRPAARRCRTPPRRAGRR